MALMQIPRLCVQSYLAERFPDYEFEAGFAEEDPLWKPGECGADAGVVS
jgi:hypothetical protein